MPTAELRIPQHVSSGAAWHDDSAGSEQPAKLQAAGRARVLIVEDEALIARDIQHRVREMGYQADWVATTGEDALALAGEISPQMVLMDLKLGKGIDGVQTTEMLRATCDVPVIYLTAFYDAETIERAKQTAPAGYLVKPFATRELRIAIEIALHRHEIQSNFTDACHCLATTIASIGDGIIATDARGYIEIANRAAAMLLGQGSSELVGKKIGDAFHIRLIPSHLTALHLTDPVSELLTTGVDRLAYTDVLLRCQRGREIPIDVTATRIVDDHSHAGGVVLVFRDVTFRQLNETDLRYRAYHDNLTGLPNRSLFYDRMQGALVQTSQFSRNFALLFLDLDDFKVVNDTLGHDIGDLLLQQVAERLKSAVRPEDTVARLAGDEFAIILNDIDGADDAREIAAKLLTTFCESFHLADAGIAVSASIGISLCPRDGTEIDRLMRCADKAMYSAKLKGKNACEIYSSGK
jgi:diguanylate cyclase (GGDEF)-like protein/PAS domain S-box-containing protein